jgi:hypothetical protein
VVSGVGWSLELNGLIKAIGLLRFWYLVLLVSGAVRLWCFWSLELLVSCAGWPLELLVSRAGWSLELKGLWSFVFWVWCIVSWGGCFNWCLAHPQALMRNNV